ncbi:MbtH family NRPS accessory protein [Streptomyces angustmyceticus]|uniref:MbtH family NRPS accessory protein n=1 Tax=Streptomyces angustmyceticus TaxID=285578 RepID=UPI00382CC9A7
MTPRSGPFGPGPEGHATHPVLENTGGQLSLWPDWRPVPQGWTRCFGPAPYDACVRHSAAGIR